MMRRLVLGFGFLVLQSCAWAQYADMSGDFSGMHEGFPGVSASPPPSAVTYKQKADYYRMTGRGSHAIEILQQGAKEGDRDSIRDLVEIYLNPKSARADLASGLAWAGRGAQLGDSALQMKLAMLHETGLTLGETVLAPNPAAALRYWSMCSAHHPSCLYRQGVARLAMKDGDGLAMIKQAASKGEPSALVWVGKVLAAGSYRLARNPIMAGVLFTLAAKRGQRDAAALSQATLASLDQQEREAALKHVKKLEAQLTATNAIPMKFRLKQRNKRHRHRMQAYAAQQGERQGVFD